MFWKLLQNEISKSTRSRLPYFGLFAVSLLCVLIYLVADKLKSGDGSNAWAFMGFSMQLVFTDIGLIFVLVFAALLLAEERGTRTLQTVLCLPVYRWELYLAKAAAGVLYMMILSLTAIFLSAILARTRYKFGPISDSLGIIYNQKQVFLNLMLACLLSWIPLSTLVLYGLVISTLIIRPGAAVAVSLGLLYLIDFTKHLVGLDPYIFTRYISYPWQVFHQLAGGVDYQWQPELWKMLRLCSLSALGAFLAGLCLFQRQDLNS